MSTKALNSILLCLFFLCFLIVDTMLNEHIQVIAIKDHYEGKQSYFKICSSSTISYYKKQNGVCMSFNTGQPEKTSAFP